MRITAFFLAFALLVVPLVMLKGMPSSEGVFSSSDPEVSRRISFLPPYDLAAIKFQHALSDPRYNVGVFGNSRVVAVGTSDLDIGERTYFNFAVPGTSLRQSINLIEELGAQGKAPELAVISFDNLELGYYKNAPYPNAVSRWRRAGEDVIWTLINRPADFVLLTHVILDHVYTEWEAFTNMWNANAIWARTAVLAPGLIPEIASARHTYTSDGSRPMPIQYGKPIEVFRRAEQRMILLPLYMARDFQRLAALDGRVTKIILYESHLDAKSSAELAASPSPRVEDERNQFRRACDGFSISCYTSRELPLPTTNSPWQDCCHPPVDALGRLISGLVRKHQSP
jgi:hypothetical protein